MKVPEYFSLTLLQVYQPLSELSTKQHGAWLINHKESYENKIHSSVLFDLQQYTFQHRQPTVIRRLSGTQSNRAASANICWKCLEHKTVEFTQLRTRVLFFVFFLFFLILHLGLGVTSIKSTILLSYWYFISIST